MGLVVVLGVIMVVVFGPSLWVRWVMREYSTEIPGMPGTGGELATHLVGQLGLRGVKVEATQLGDHYDPTDKVVRLSESNMQGRSLTAIAASDPPMPRQPPKRKVLLLRSVWIPTKWPKLTKHSHTLDFN